MQIELHQCQCWLHCVCLYFILYLHVSSLKSIFFNCRVPAVATHGATNQSNGKSVHGSADQSLIGSVTSVPKSSSVANDTGNQENVQPQVAAVATASSPIQTVDSVTSIEQGKSLSSSDQLHASAAAAASGVCSSSSDPVLASSISRTPGVSGAISREVGSHWISSGANHVKGNKDVLNEDGDLPPSKSENSVSVNSTSKKNAPYESNEVENSWLSEPSQPSSSSSLNGSLKSCSSSSSQPSPGKVFILYLLNLMSNRIALHVLFPAMNILVLVESWSKQFFQMHAIMSPPHLERRTM